MKLTAELKTIYNIAVSPKYTDHASWLNAFYKGQAQDYDRFRKRLLSGREEMISLVPFSEESTWVDLGAGTGSNIEHVAGNHFPKKTYIVDLCAPLLDVAAERAKASGRLGIEVVEADATSFTPAEGQVDIVTMSYSLTMMPDWFKVLENVRRILKPGGHIGIADFYVSGKHAKGVQHGWLKRSFWPLWFEQDNVFLSPHHLQYLEHHFTQVDRKEAESKVPYIPKLKVPYYIFVGKLI